MASTTTPEEFGTLTKDAASTPEQLENGYQHKTSTGFSEYPDDREERNSSQTKTGPFREEESQVASLFESVVIEDVAVPENVILEAPRIQNSENNRKDEGTSISNTQTAQLRQEDFIVLSVKGSVIIEVEPVPGKTFRKTPVVENSDKNKSLEGISNCESDHLGQEEIKLSSLSGSVIVEEELVPGNSVIEILEENSNNRGEVTSNSENAQFIKEEVLVSSISESIIIEEVPVPENVIIETSMVENSDNNEVNGVNSYPETAQLKEEDVQVSSISGSVIIEEVPSSETIITDTPVAEISHNSGRGEGIISLEIQQIREEVLVSSPTGQIIIKEVPVPENAIIETPVVDNSDNNEIREGISNSETAQLKEEEVHVSSISESVIIDEVPGPENVIIETPVADISDNNDIREGISNSETAQLKEEEVQVSSISGSVIIEKVPGPETLIIDTPVVEISDNSGRGEGIISFETQQIREEVLVSSPSERIVIEEVPVPENVIIKTPVVDNSDNNEIREGISNSETAQFKEEDVQVSSITGSFIIEEVPGPENVIIETPVVDNSDNNEIREGISNSETAQLKEEEVQVSSISGSVIIEEVPVPENVIIETPVADNSDNNEIREGMSNSETAQHKEEEVQVSSISGSGLIEEVPGSENVIIETPVADISDNNDIREGISNSETAQLKEEEVQVSSISGSVIIEEVPVPENVIIETPVADNSDNNEIREGMSNSETAQHKEEEVQVSSISGSGLNEEVPGSENVIIETPVVDNSDNNEIREGISNSEKAQIKAEEVHVPSISASVIIEQVRVPAKVIIETPVIDNSDNNVIREGISNSETAQLTKEEVQVSSIPGSVIIEEVPGPENAIIETPVVNNSDSNEIREGISNSETAQLKEEEVQVSSIPGSVIIEEMPGPETIIIESPVVEISDNSGRGEGIISLEIQQMREEVLVSSPTGQIIVKEIPVPENAIIETPIVDNSDNNEIREGISISETAQLKKEEVQVSSIPGSVIIEEVPGPETIVIDTPVVEISDNSGRGEGIISLEIQQIREEILVSSPTGQIIIKEVPVPENGIRETPVADNSDNNEIREVISKFETAQLTKEDVQVSSIPGSFIIEEVPGPENVIIETPVAENSDNNDIGEGISNSETAQLKKEEVQVSLISGSGRIEEVPGSENVIIEAPVVDNSDNSEIRDGIANSETAQLQEEEVEVSSISGTVIIEEVPVPEKVIIETPVVKNSDNNEIREVISNSEKAQIKDEKVQASSISTSVIIEEVRVPAKVIIETPVVANSYNNEIREEMSNSETAQLTKEDVQVSSIPASVTIEEVPGPENVIIETPVAENSDNNEIREGISNSEISQLEKEEVQVSSIPGSVIIEEVPGPENAIIETPVVDNSDNNEIREVISNAETAQLKEQEVQVSSIPGSVIIEEVPGPETIIIDTPVVEISDNSGRGEGLISLEIQQLREEVLVPSPTGHIIIDDVPVPENVIIETPVVANSDNNEIREGISNSETAQLTKEDVQVSSIPGSVIIEELPGPENVIINTPVPENSDNNDIREGISNSETAQFKKEEVQVSSIPGSVIIEEVPGSENAIIETPVVDNSDNNEIREVISNAETAQLKEQEVQVSSIPGSVIIEEVPGPETIIIDTPVVEISDNSGRGEGLISLEIQQLREEVLVPSPTGHIIIDDVPVPENVIIETPVVANSDNNEIREGISNSEKAQLTKEDVQVSSIPGSVIFEEVPGPENVIIETPVAENSDNNDVREGISNSEIAQFKKEEVQVSSIPGSFIIEQVPGPETIIIDTPVVEISDNSGRGEGLISLEIQQLREEVLVSSPSGHIIIEDVPVPENVIIETPIVANSDNNEIREGISNSETAQLTKEDVQVSSIQGSVIIEEVPGTETIVIDTPVVEISDNSGRGEGLISLEIQQLREEVLVSSPTGHIIIEDVPVPENVIIETPVVENSDNNEIREGISNSETAQLKEEDVQVSSISGSAIIEEVPGPENAIIETPVVDNSDNNEIREVISNAETVQLKEEEVQVSSIPGSVIIVEVPGPETIIIDTPVVEISDNSGRGEGLISLEIQQLREEVLVSSPTGHIIIEDVPVPENVIIETPVVENSDNNEIREGISNSETAQLTKEDVQVSSIQGSVIVEEVPGPENVIIETPVAENSDNIDIKEVISNSETAQLKEEEVQVSSIPESVIIEDVPGPETIIKDTPVVEISDNSVRGEGLISLEIQQLREEVLVSSPTGHIIIEDVPVPENVIIETPVVENSDNNEIREGISNSETAQLKEEDVQVSSISGSAIIEEVPGPENAIIETPVVDNSDNNEIREVISNAETVQLKEEEVQVSSIPGSVIIVEVPGPETIIIDTPVVEISKNSGRGEGLISLEIQQLREEVLVSSPTGHIIIEDVPVPENVIIETPIVENSDNNEIREGISNSETAQLTKEDVQVFSIQGSFIIEEVPGPENVIIETPVAENSDNNDIREVISNSETAQLKEEEVQVSSIPESVIIEDVPGPETIIKDTPVVEISDNSGRGEGLISLEIQQLREEVLVSSPTGHIIIEDVPIPENVIIETPVVENSDNNEIREGISNSETAQLTKEDVQVSSIQGSVIVEEVPGPENVIIETPVAENSDNIDIKEVISNSETAQLKEEEVQVSSIPESVIIEDVPGPETIIKDTPVVEISDNSGRGEGLISLEIQQLREEVLVSSPTGHIIIEDVPIPENVIIETPVVENSDNNEIREGISNSETAQLKEEVVQVSSISGSAIIEEEVPGPETIVIDTPIVEISDNSGRGVGITSFETQKFREEVQVSWPSGGGNIEELPEVESSIIEKPAAGNFIRRPVVAAYNVENAVPVVELRNGVTLPAIGFGTCEIEPDEVYHAVKNAINAGFRHIDCALVYQNESEVGAAITDSIRDGVVRREDLFITSKLWNTFHKPTLVEASCRQTLADLGVDYLDLYLIHSPIGYKEGKKLVPRIAGVLQYSNTDYLEAWYAMEMLVKKGLVKSIGLSNFNSQQVKRVFSKAKVNPVINQVECHPLLNQNRLSDCCKRLGIVLTAYSPLCTRSQLLDDPTVLSVSQKYGRTPAQILLRYQLDKGNVVLTRTVQPERMLEALAVGEFQLESQDVKLLDSMNRNRRYHIMYGESHKEYPFKIPF